MNSNIQNIKQRFEIVGIDPGLDRAIEKAIRVSPTDISVLITGESGVGKEIIRIKIKVHKKLMKQSDLQIFQ